MTDGLASARDAVSARIPERFRDAMQRAALALFVLTSGYLLFHALEARGWPERLPDAITPGF